ncbi:uL13 family ribosomal protein [Candidatus Kaiserbacteria bacterium]|nr:uL13 family ribosomal protein [Candidatus Kaiserbacteria bacterium]NCT01723.1 uL13 family ribosomal protein [Candidatus Parcubacteria bacterium]
MTTTENTARTHTINAAGKRLGIIATEAASVLMGKDQATFAKHIVENVIVTIEHASKMDIPDKKKGEIYQSYSGYPGGRRTETLEHLGKRLGYAEVVRRTVEGMLPGNKHKKRLMKQLIVTE